MVFFMRKEELSGKYVLLDKGATLLVYDFKVHKAVVIPRKAALDDLAIKNYILNQHTGVVDWSVNVQAVGETGRPVDLHYLCLDHCGRQKYVMYCYSFSEKRLRAFKYPESYLDNKFSIFVGNGELKDLQEVLDTNVIVYATYKEISDVLCNQEVFGIFSIEKEELIGNYLSNIAPRRLKVIKVMEKGVVLAVNPRFAMDCATRAQVVAKINSLLGVGDEWVEDGEKTEFVDELMTLNMV